MSAPSSYSSETLALVGTAIALVDGPTVLKEVQANNNTAAVAYVQLFDIASSNVGDITVGTTRADWIVYSAASLQSLSGQVPPNGLLFRKGIAGVSTTVHDGATGASQDVRLAI